MYININLKDSVGRTSRCCVLKSGMYQDHANQTIEKRPSATRSVRTKFLTPMAPWHLKTADISSTVVVVAPLQRRLGAAGCPLLRL